MANVIKVGFDAPKHLWLFPMSHAGRTEIVWCDSPCPDDNIDPEESAGYTRNDLVEELLKEISRLRKWQSAADGFVRLSTCADCGAYYNRGYCCPDCGSVNPEGAR